MKCPKCGYSLKQPVNTQIEAYNLVYLKGLKLDEAARLLGITKQAVQQRIVRLLKSFPKIGKPG